MIRIIQLMAFSLVLTACDAGSDFVEGYSLVYVQDGDSVVLCCDKGEKFTVRLLDIDAPERYQPYAETSKQQLRELLEGESLSLFGAKYDKYGRRLAVIKADGVNVNDKMVETGAAWVWRYSKNRQMRELQEEARDDERGLWALPQAQRQDPWLWRQQHQR
ncbi:thermonuclease family protein [Kangiella shandongensis]|uniref:thermonuclease family protein n=1 Tax=Kangiella shandongensis TaxID=2763258 RepID=UPI001CC1297A|nr:thermonuclease family protein [Kangiella shandongensis]